MGETNPESERLLTRNRWGLRTHVIMLLLRNRHRSPGSRRLEQDLRIAGVQLSLQSRVIGVAIIRESSPMKNNSLPSSRQRGCEPPCVDTCVRAPAWGKRTACQPITAGFVRTRSNTIGRQVRSRPSTLESWNAPRETARAVTRRR